MPRSPHEKSREARAGGYVSKRPIRQCITGLPACEVETGSERYAECGSCRKRRLAAKAS